MRPIELPTLQPGMPESLSPERLDVLKGEVRALAEERGAVILAHNYQLPEVQEVAHFVGDSLGLSRKAAASGAEVIAFCGVHFMAETASILCPDSKVLIPDLQAGCSLADSITAEGLGAWKARHPGAVVVMYVNTSAEVKAETDYCCTSSNAVQVVEHIGASTARTRRSSSALTCGWAPTSSARSAGGCRSGTANVTCTRASGRPTSPPCARRTPTPSS